MSTERQVIESKMSILFWFFAGVSGRVMKIGMWSQSTIKQISMGHWGFALYTIYAERNLENNHHE